MNYHAYSDESKYNQGRYRSVCAVTLSEMDTPGIEKELRRLLNESEVAEMKWQKVKSAKYRFAAEKLFLRVVDYAVNELLRVDTLIWDTHDERHSVQGRDDIRNFQIMYYHLFRWVLKKAWPSELDWHLFPDTQDSIEWDTMQDVLDIAGLGFEPLPSDGKVKLYSMRLVRDFNIKSIQPVDSRHSALVQVADLFAGIGVYSRESFDDYKLWVDRENKMDSLIEPGVATKKFTQSEESRYYLMRELNSCCKKNKLQVSLESEKGFGTKNNKKPINFWLYKPQRDSDRAPRRESN